MLTNKEIEVLCYCRGCLNRKCGLDLERSDIQYYYDVLNICKCCQQEKHVVFSIKPLSRWKLLKGHSPRYSRKKIVWSLNQEGDNKAKCTFDEQMCSKYD